jgi:hypothetical protein
MLGRLPFIFGAVAALAVLLFLGPVAAAVVLLRSSSDAQGPGLAAQLFIAILVLAVAAVAGLAGWALGRLVLRLAGGGGRP